MISVSLPALYKAANREAARAQRQYFRMLRGQYFCLFVASMLTLFSSYVDQMILLASYFFLLVCGALAALTLATAKPNQNWYRFRALAESCKTLSWRYMMRADPFPETSHQIDLTFATRLHELVTFHPIDATRLTAVEDADEQATAGMRDIQRSDFELRKAYYLEHRIDNQLNWYKKKADTNRRASEKSLALIVLVYIAAMAATGAQFYYPVAQDQVIWVAEPLLVLAASLLGYSQAKRFSELSTSYSLTALEIQKLRSGFMLLQNDTEFRSYVNTAEDAFSREHTQWIARAI